MTIDLYNEILKFQSVSKTKAEFAEELVGNPEVRDNFLREVVDEIIDSLDTKEIICAYSECLFQDLNDQCGENEEEYIIQECAKRFPYVLQRFGVDVKENA